MLEIFNSALLVQDIFSRWYESIREKNYGALSTFVGTVRAENDIEALSFDIYEPLLQAWFEKWQEKAKEQNAILFMAHSNGDVRVHFTSFMAGVASPQRKTSLKLINEFVEDFKANAPIWKYDVINQERIYAKNRSTLLNGAGILGD